MRLKRSCSREDNVVVSQARANSGEFVRGGGGGGSYGYGVDHGSSGSYMPVAMSSSMQGGVYSGDLGHAYPGSSDGAGLVPVGVETASAQQMGRANTAPVMDPRPIASVADPVIPIGVVIPNVSTCAYCHRPLVSARSSSSCSDDTNTMLTTNNIHCAALIKMSARYKEGPPKSQAVLALSVRAYVRRLWYSVLNPRTRR